MVLVRLVPWEHTSKDKAEGQGRGPLGTADAAWLSWWEDMGGQPAQQEICKTLGKWRVFPGFARVRFKNEGRVLSACPGPWQRREQHRQAVPGRAWSPCGIGGTSGTNDPGHSAPPKRQRVEG